MGGCVSTPGRASYLAHRSHHVDADGPVSPDIDLAFARDMDRRDGEGMAALAVAGGGE